MLFFIIFGWQRIIEFSGPIGYTDHSGLPLPTLSAAIAFGAWTLTLVLLLAVYALATVFIAHHYCTTTSSTGFEAEINFYRNISIIGGLLALFAMGSGRYTLDEILRSRAATHASK
ncbi:DoxX family protein [Salinisphaera hydrothermalis]|uniref:DoxX family protein n=1 Tax=Salinisphaera hydrothermalis TaxID=563188 RepID=UPI003340FCC6